MIKNILVSKLSFCFLILFILQLLFTSCDSTNDINNGEDQLIKDIKIAIRNNEDLNEYINVYDDDKNKYYTRLHLAARNNYLQAMHFLINEGVDVNCLDKIVGATPLHRALQNGHLDAAKLLINNGAIIEAKDESGQTPIFYAISYEGNSLPLIRYLVESNVSIMAKQDSDGQPLHHAAYFNKSDIASFLIDKGAGLDVIDNEGNTPLHTAAYFASADVAKVLLKKGANVNAVNNLGLTPLSMSLEGYYDIPKKKFDKVSKIIRSYGGKVADN